jgi:hypothetical protein
VGSLAKIVPTIYGIFHGIPLNSMEMSMENSMEIFMENSMELH